MMLQNVEHPKVLTVLPSQVKQLQTTKSWDYLGLESNGEVPADSLWRKAKFGEDIIIATLDSGNISLYFTIIFVLFF